MHGLRLIILSSENTTKYDPLISHFSLSLSHPSPSLSHPTPSLCTLSPLPLSVSLCVSPFSVCFLIFLQHFHFLDPVLGTSIQIQIFAGGDINSLVQNLIVKNDPLRFYWGENFRLSFWLILYNLFCVVIWNIYYFICRTLKNTKPYFIHS